MDHNSHIKKIPSNKASHTHTLEGQGDKKGTTQTKKVKKEHKWKTRPPLDSKITKTHHPKKKEKEKLFYKPITWSKC